MPRGGAQFSTEELVRVLSHYDVGVILQIKTLISGNRRAPKTIIVSDRGKYLLKRRPRGKDDLYHVAFAHAVQNHLYAKGFPVTALLATRSDNNTILQMDNHIYEFFEYISGSRYDGSAEATVDTGRRLADFHLLVADFAYKPELFEGLQSCFHNASNVRRHLKTIGADKTTRPAGKMKETAEALTILYNSSSDIVGSLGFDDWKPQVIHGDWHPGNMLFSRRRVAAVLDFDSVRIAPPVTDLSNAMLQFSIIGGRPNPADWPDYFDTEKLIQVLNGYRRINKLDKKRTDSLLDLMIETMIAEAVLPIAATGFFGHLSGLEFLQTIRRKAGWLNTHRDELIEAMKP